MLNITRESRLNGSSYRNAFCTTKYSNVCSFLRPNIMVVNLGVLFERVY